jgi:hypothetical protein
LKLHKYNPLLGKNRAPANLLLKKHMHEPCLEHREEICYGEQVWLHSNMFGYKLATDVEAKLQTS